MARTFFWLIFSGATFGLITQSAEAAGLGLLTGLILGLLFEKNARIRKRLKDEKEHAETSDKPLNR